MTNNTNSNNPTKLISDIERLIYLARNATPEPSTTKEGYLGARVYKNHSYLLQHHHMPFWRGMPHSLALTRMASDFIMVGQVMRERHKVDDFVFKPHIYYKRRRGWDFQLESFRSHLSYLRQFGIIDYLFEPNKARMVYLITPTQDKKLVDLFTNRSPYNADICINRGVMFEYGKVLGLFYSIALTQVVENFSPIQMTTGDFRGLYDQLSLPVPSQQSVEQYRKTINNTELLTINKDTNKGYYDLHPNFLATLKQLEYNERWSDRGHWFAPKHRQTRYNIPEGNYKRELDFI